MAMDSIRKSAAVITRVAMLWVFVDPNTATAQDHVVPLASLSNRLSQGAAERARNVEDIERVLSLPAAQAALGKAGVDQIQLHRAVSLLDDQEVSRLAQRARSAEHDVEGGLIVGLLALIGLVVVVLAVVAIVNKD